MSSPEVAIQHKFISSLLHPETVLWQTQIGYSIPVLTNVPIWEERWIQGQTRGQKPLLQGILFSIKVENQEKTQVPQCS